MKWKCPHCNKALSPLTLMQIIRSYQARYERFMRIDAAAHQIHMFLQKERLTPGICWGGSLKSSMADAFAEFDHRFGMDERVIEKLEKHFGIKEK